MCYPSVIELVEEIIHEQVATVQRSTLESSDLVEIISVWYEYEWRHLEQKRVEYNHYLSRLYYIYVVLHFIISNNGYKDSQNVKTHILDEIDHSFLDNPRPQMILTGPRHEV